MTRVLVIDDEEDILLMIRIALEFDGHEVTTATTGEAGLELARRDAPDVILLDIRLPGIDGWEVLDRVRADPRIGRIPIVMISAHATPSTPRRALGQGATAYLTKPFRPEDLRKAISEALG